MHDPLNVERAVSDDLRRKGSGDIPNQHACGASPVKSKRERNSRGYIIEIRDRYRTSITL
jgi:hypothetical protein